MFSKVLRRTHMYLALFLAPWVLIYTLSTFVMNHREWFRGHNAPPPAFEKEREFTYDGSFPENARPRDIGLQLLQSLQMDGAFQANRRPRDGAIVVNRMDPIRPIRLTVDPATKNVVIERQIFDGTAFLERMHRRRGFQHDFLLDDLWAFSVDLFILTIIFWAASGLWLWWEMKLTRKIGALFLAGGVALFAFFLAVL
jgi:hypothetical protein